MLKLRFNNDHDELKFFVQIREIEKFSDVKIKCAVLVKDKDLPDGPSDPDRVC